MVVCVIRSYRHNSLLVHSHRKSMIMSTKKKSIIDQSVEATNNAETLLSTLGIKAIILELSSKETFHCILAVLSLNDRVVWIIYFS